MFLATGISIWWSKIISNTDDNVNGAVITTKPFGSVGSFDECGLSARRPLTFKRSQPIWAVRPWIGCYHPHPPSPFIIITHSENRYSFNVPLMMEG